MRENGEIISNPDSKHLLKTVIIRFAGFLFLFGLMFFLPAGTFRYWEAWVYLIILFIPVAFIARYLYNNDPKLLERRMRMKERQPAQKMLIAFSWVFFLSAYIIPGFDERFHWSNLHYSVVIIADVLVLLGYLIIALVFRTNSYASRIVEVEKGQRVITTGPYAVVRHPMYVGVLIFYLFSPLALGSYWAMIPALSIIPILVVRIRGEERELMANLPGYREYVQKTKYRILPGIW